MAGRVARWRLAPPALRTYPSGVLYDLPSENTFAKAESRPPGSGWSAAKWGLLRLELPGALGPATVRFAGEHPHLAVSEWIAA